jgi:hypothetical protein
MESSLTIRYLFGVFQVLQMMLMMNQKTCIGNCCLEK